MAASGGDTAIAAYEDLRRHVLAGAAFDSRFGQVVLLREGVAAWMARRSACSAQHTPAAAPERSGAAPVSDELHAGIVGVLASMALAGRGEMSA